MIAVEAVNVKPYHETIVDAIRRASSRDLECLAPLIKATKIPKGHDEIIAAWEQRSKELCWGNNDLGVSVAILAQKQMAEALAQNEPFIVWQPEIFPRFQNEAAIEELHKMIHQHRPQLIILHSWQNSSPWQLQGTYGSSCRIDKSFKMGFRLMDGKPVIGKEFIWPIMLADYINLFPILGIQML